MSKGRSSRRPTSIVAHVVGGRLLFPSEHEQLLKRVLGVSERRFFVADHAIRSKPVRSAPLWFTTQDYYQILCDARCQTSYDPSGVDTEVLSGLYPTLRSRLRNEGTELRLKFEEKRIYPDIRFPGFPAVDDDSREFRRWFQGKMLISPRRQVPELIARIIRANPLRQIAVLAATRRDRSRLARLIGTELLRSPPQTRDDETRRWRVWLPAELGDHIDVDIDLDAVVVTTPRMLLHPHRFWETEAIMRLPRLGIIDPSERFSPLERLRLEGVFGPDWLDVPPSTSQVEVLTIACFWTHHLEQNLLQLTVELAKRHTRSRQRVCLIVQTREQLEGLRENLPGWQVAASEKRARLYLGRYNGSSPLLAPESDHVLRLATTTEIASKIARDIRPAILINADPWTRGRELIAIVDAAIAAQPVAVVDVALEAISETRCAARLRQARFKLKKWAFGPVRRLPGFGEEA